LYPNKINPNIFIMKKNTLLTIACLLLLIGSVKSQTALAGNTTTANLINPLVISTSASMNFGDLVLVDVTNATTITVDPDTGNTVVTSSADAQVLPVGAAGVRGLFSVTADQDLLFNITITDSTPLTAASGGGADIVISNFKFKPGTGMAEAGVLDNGSGYSCTASNGIGAFTAGADIIVAAAQLPGVYSGTYEITVTYQ
jgi:hypothetical protein